MPRNKVALHEFPSRESLAESLALTVASALNDAIVERGKALLAVSGGNTPALFIGFGLMFAFGIAAYYLQNRLDDRTTLLVGLTGFSMPFLITALFELRSGYIWRNLSPGNRGISRSASRTKFLGSVALNLLVALVILGYGLWHFFAS